MSEQIKPPVSSTKLWLRENKRRWIPLAIIIGIIVVVVLAFMFMGGQKKDKGEYMKLLEEHHEAGETK